MIIKKFLDFQGQKVVLVMDLAFDKETGVYCKEWQLFEHKADVLLIDQLKEFDVRLLPADDVIELAREMQATINANSNGFGAFASQWRSVNH